MTGRHRRQPDYTVRYLGVDISEYVIVSLWAVVVTLVLLSGLLEVVME